MTLKEYANKIASAIHGKKSYLNMQDPEQRREFINLIKEEKRNCVPVDKAIAYFKELYQVED